MGYSPVAPGICAKHQHDADALADMLQGNRQRVDDAEIGKGGHDGGEEERGAFAAAPRWPARRPQQIAACSTAIAASSRSAGKTYEEAIGGRWALDVPMPGEAKDMVVLNAETDIDRIAAQVDFVFSAVDMKKEEIQALEEAYARRGCPVVSNNSAHRWTPDVPMVVPEINAEHLAVIEAQRKRLGTKRGSLPSRATAPSRAMSPPFIP